MKEIYRGPEDTQLEVVSTAITCPYCSEEWREDNKDGCGVTYLIECEKCGNKFNMHFDA